jgi:hypothetical protein
MSCAVGQATRAPPGGSGGTITLKIFKQIKATATVVVKQITAQPIGVPTEKGVTFALPEPFSCTEGATLDLSANWAVLVDGAVIRDRVLPASPPQ